MAFPVEIDPINGITGFNGFIARAGPYAYERSPGQIDRYVFISRQDTGELQAYKSTDGGNTFSIQDSAGVPYIIGTHETPWWASTDQNSVDNSKFYCTYLATSTHITTVQYDAVSDTWGSALIVCPDPPTPDQPTFTSEFGVGIVTVFEPSRPSVILQTIVNTIGTSGASVTGYNILAINTATFSLSTWGSWVAFDSVPDPTGGVDFLNSTPTAAAVGSAGITHCFYSTPAGNGRGFVFQQAVLADDSKGSQVQIPYFANTTDTIEETPHIMPLRAAGDGTHVWAVALDNDNTFVNDGITWASGTSSDPISFTTGSIDIADGFGDTVLEANIVIATNTTSWAGVSKDGFYTEYGMSPQASIPVLAFTTQYLVFHADTPGGGFGAAQHFLPDGESSDPFIYLNAWYIAVAPPPTGSPGWWVYEA